jgi:hypothetical protein
MPVAERLPQGARTQVESGIENWNRFFGTRVRATGWSVESRIESLSDRNAVIEEALSPANAWFPSGDVDKPAEMTAARIADHHNLRPATIGSWQRDVARRFEAGQYVFKVMWSLEGNEFETVGVASADQILYDSMLSNACLSVDVPTGRVVGNPKKRCFYRKLGWIWQKDPSRYHRGEIYVDMLFECRQSKLAKCDGGCSGQLTLGKAEAKCRATTVRNQCRLEYSWAWVTGLKTIKLGADKLTLEIEGHLGSGGKGNGSDTANCT